ncbi:hypothetical protein VTO73DRAFT_8488 [Trametes versicolor]
MLTDPAGVTSRRARRDARPRLRGGEHASILSPATASPEFATSGARDPRAVLVCDVFRARSGAHCADANSDNVELDRGCVDVRPRSVSSGLAQARVAYAWAWWSARSAEVIKARSRLMLRHTASRNSRSGRDSPERSDTRTRIRTAVRRMADGRLSARLLVNEPTQFLTLPFP